MNKKIVFTILIVACLVILLTGGTYAYLSWASNSDDNTNVTFTKGEGFSCSADGGGNITTGEISLMPTDCTKNSSHVIKREITVNTTITDINMPIYMDLWLDVNSMGTALSNSSNLKYSLTTSSTNCATDVVKTGTFNGQMAGDKVTMISGNTYNSTTTETYYLYIWLDINETNADTASQSFSLSLNGSCSNEIRPYSENILNGATPILDEGMIPIVFDTNGTDTLVKTISKYDSNWYSYQSKKWANAVLVTESSRSNYLNTSGVTIQEEDILGYFVWIPRYKYKIWTTGVSSKGNEQEIDIVFEDKDTPKSIATQVGEYYTHPAFTFGDTELDGFWMAKFETTGTADEPMIIPNKISLHNQNISSHFTTALKFAGGTQSGSVVTFAGNSTYGLTSKTDSHMLKNSEWGAVAYLSHSKYGINSEIYINNSSQTYTGRSGGNVGGKVNTTDVQFASMNLNTEITNSSLVYKNSDKKIIFLGPDLEAYDYNYYGYYTYDGKIVNENGIIGNYASDRTLGYNASTTGNIYGVYDMSGGASEYVMGNFANTIGNSGFTTLPDSKYYDVYSSDVFTGNYTTNISLCTLATCGGQALSETAAWYSDYPKFVYSSYVWFVRGERSTVGVYAGSFGFNFGTGGISNIGFRVSLSFVGA